MIKIHVVFIFQILSHFIVSQSISMICVQNQKQNLEQKTLSISQDRQKYKLAGIICSADNIHISNSDVKNFEITCSFQHSICRFPFKKLIYQVYLGKKKNEIQKKEDVFGIISRNKQNKVILVANIEEIFLDLKQKIRQNRESNSVQMYQMNQKNILTAIQTGNQKNIFGKILETEAIKYFIEYFCQQENIFRDEDHHKNHSQILQSAQNYDREKNYQRNVRNLQGLTINNSIEYIINGDFSNTTCTTYCIWTIPTFTASKVVGWNPLPEIQIGKGSLYVSGASGLIKAIQLAGNAPTCIWQLISGLHSGLYSLKYMYAARASVVLPKSDIHIFLNGSEVHVTWPQNYSINTEVVSNITIQNNNDSVNLKICGNPTGNGDSSVIFSVSFKRTGDLPPPIPINQTTNSTNSTAANTTNTTSASTTNTSNTSNTQVNTTNTSSTNQTSGQSTTNSSSNTTNQVNQNSWSFSPSYNDSASIQDANLTYEQANALALKLKNITLDETVYLLLESLRPEKNMLGFFLQNLFDLNTSSTIPKIIELTMKFPASRVLLRGSFSYLINLDHLWLYMYHKRPYGIYFKDFLKSLHKYEEQKWNFLEVTTESISGIKLDLTQVEQKLNKKQTYTPLEFSLIQQNSRNFMRNNFKFFLMNLPLVIMVFFICRGLHYLLKKNHMGIFFQQFALKSYLILIVFEGNTESFTYFLFSDILTLFSQDLQVKFSNFVSILLLFTLLFFLIAFPFFLRSIHELKSRVQFYEKTSNSFSGTVYFMVEFGLFNISLGGIHLLCEGDPSAQLTVLSLIETSFILYNASNFMRQKSIYRNKFEIWVGISTSFLRIKFIFSSHLFSVYTGAAKDKIEEIQLIYILIYLLLWVISAFHSMIGQLNSIAEFLIEKKKLYCKNQQKIRGKKNSKNHRNKKNKDKDEQFEIISQTLADGKKQMREKQTKFYQQKRGFLLNNLKANSNVIRLSKNHFTLIKGVKKIETAGGKDSLKVNNVNKKSINKVRNLFMDKISLIKRKSFQVEIL